MLWSVGPVDMSEDEKKIGAGYRWHFAAIPAVIMLIAGAYLETAQVVGLGFALSFYYLNDIASRLYDLCIRTRRTNLILRQSTGKDGAETLS